jgi:hypothetical protein
MAYRDAGGKLEAELARLAEEVRALALQITPAYWRRLDPGLGAWRERLEASGDEPRERLDSLSTLRDELRLAIDQAPGLEAALRALPRRVPAAARGPRPPPSAVDLRAAEWVEVPYARAQRLEAKVARVVGRHDPRALVSAWRSHVAVGGFEAHGAPMALHVETFFGASAVSVATAVARGAPSLEVRRLVWHHQLTTALRWHVDTPLGDRAFDDHFLVEGAESARLLTPEIRAQLLALSRWTPPSLRIGEGAAVLSFRYLFSEELLERGLRVMAAVRHAPLSLSLLRR